MATTFEPQRTKFKPIHLIAIFSVLIVVIFVIISLETIFHKNPFGEELKIDNFSKYYKKVPEETRNSVFASLYNTASLNVTDSETPTSGAIIRPDSTSEKYDQSTEIYSGNFIVDIESIQQSFQVYMEWSKKSNNSNLTGYTVTISCLTGSSSAYGSTKCIDMFDGNSDNIPALYPIVYDLPLEVSEYNNNYTVYTHYTITYNIEKDNKIIVYITDYTGGNHQNALKKIRELGYTPDLYNIQYIDQSSEEIPARPADYNF